MRVYQLIVETESLSTSYLFKQQPARKEIVNLLTKIWRKLCPLHQNDMWDLLLVAYTCPEKPWLGIWKNIFGSLQCMVHGVIE